MKNKIICLLILPLMASLGLKAQLKEEKNSERKTQKIEANKRIQSSLFTPNANSSIISTYSDIRLKSDFGDQSASATMGFTLGQSSLSFYFEQPFEDKPKKVTFFNQNGLQAGTAFKIAFQHVFWKPDTDMKGFNKIEEIKNVYAKNNHITDSQKIREIAIGDMDDISYAKALEEMRIGTPVLFGLSFSGAKNNIDFLTDSLSIKPLNQVKLNQNLQVAFGLMLKKGSVLALSYTRESKFKGADETSVFNFPITGSAATYQKEAGVGSPKKILENKFQLEYRKLFVEPGVGPSFAINPRIFYLTSNKSFNFELPVYCLRFSEEGKVKGLQGGFSLGYSSKLTKVNNLKDGFAASIFVAAPFDLFNLFKTK
jgi:hypothetical protein